MGDLRNNNKKGVGVLLPLPGHLLFRYTADRKAALVCDDDDDDNSITKKIIIIIIIKCMWACTVIRLR